MSTDGKSGPGPAYVAFPSFRTLLEQFKEHGTPGRIDRSVMGNFSGGTQSHLISTLRFLRLIGPDSVPTPKLRPLADAVGTDQWATALRPIITEGYADVLGDLDLATATPSQLASKFRDGGLDGSTHDKAMRFFLQSLKEAEIPHSAHLGRRRKQIGSNGRRPSVNRRGNDTPPAPNGNSTRSGSDVFSAPPSPGTVTFPVYLKGKSAGQIVLPDNISSEDIPVLKITLDLIEAYAKQ